MSRAISIRLPQGLSDQLDGIMKETGRPRSHIIREALETYLGDCADLQVALDRLGDKTDQVISGKEMRDLLACKGVREESVRGRRKEP